MLRGSINDFGDDAVEPVRHTCDACPYCFVCDTTFPTYCKGRDHSPGHREQMFYAYGRNVDATTHSCGCEFCRSILAVKKDLDKYYTENDKFYGSDPKTNAKRWKEIMDRKVRVQYPHD